MTLQEQVRAYMKKHGTPQAWFCRKLGGISGTHFHGWLNGERPMAEHRLDTLKEIIAQ
jgi:hypothetical protein